MLTDETYAALDAALADADRALALDYPGEQGRRQPVHTVYIPADRYSADTPAQWGRLARSAFDAALATPPALAQVIGVDATVAAQVAIRVRNKLDREPIEDVRLDFEDGYGAHSDADEDAAARAGADALNATSTARPPFAGLRIKSLDPATRRRGIRTLDLFLQQLLSHGPLPGGFIVTLPKVTHVDQVRAFAELCAALESSYGLDAGTLKFEVQIETPQAILAADGRAAVAQMVHGGAGRVTALHYGTYDYSAATGIAGPYQSLDHPVADHAKAVMQLAAAGTGVQLSDGSTNIVPVGSPQQIESAWRLHARLVRRSLERGYYQGWDLHPLQLITRHAATYAFYREAMPGACERLRAYLGHSGSGAILDEPATAQALAALLVRGLHCGAIDADEVQDGSGANPEELERIYERRSR